MKTERKKMNMKQPESNYRAKKQKKERKHKRKGTSQKVTTEEPVSGSKQKEIRKATKKQQESNQVT